MNCYTYIFLRISVPDRFHTLLKIISNNEQVKLRHHTKKCFQILKKFPEKKTEKKKKIFQKKLSL